MTDDGQTGVERTDSRDVDGEATPTIAVTGAAEYIGSHVIVEVQAAHPDWHVIAIDNMYRGQVTAVGDVDIKHVDIRNRGRLEDALAGVDIVCHLAVISGVDDCDEQSDLAYKVNVIGTTWRGSVRRRVQRSCSRSACRVR